MYGLEISFNGKKQRLRLDTGVSGFLLTSKTAARLGLTTEEHEGGDSSDQADRQARISHVARISIGDLQFENCTVEILPQSKFKNSSVFEEIDGIVGADTFSQYLLTLDYPRGEFQLAPLPERIGEQQVPSSLVTGREAGGPKANGRTDGLVIDRYRSPGMQDWAQFFRVGHRLLLPVQLNNGPVKLFDVDTGADESRITPNAAKLVTTLTENRFFLEGPPRFITNKLVLHFANLFLPMDSMDSFALDELSDAAGVEISGFLGFPALRQMTIKIDYRDGLIHFDFDPKSKVSPRFLINHR